MRVASCLFGWLLLFEIGSASAAEPADLIADALHAAIAKNTQHARDWLDERDYKSLAQSAAGLESLADLLKSRGDDAVWQQATTKIIAATRELASAAKAEDVAASKQALMSLEAACVALEKQSLAGKPLPPSKAASIRPLMLLMDGLYADAKIAVIAGNPAAAKKQAYVLSELGRVLSNSPGGRRGGDRWPELSRQFIETSLVAAQSPANDAPTVRQLLKGVSERCEACHETR